MTESETGLTDTAEPAAAGERQESKPHSCTYLVQRDIIQRIKQVQHYQIERA